MDSATASSQWSCVQQSLVDLELPLWIALGAKNKKYRRLLIAPLDQFNRAEKESGEWYARAFRAFKGKIWALKAPAKHFTQED